MLWVSSAVPDVHHVGRIILSAGQSDSFLCCVLLFQSASYFLNIQHVWSLAECVSQTGLATVEHCVCRICQSCNHLQLKWMLRNLFWNTDTVTVAVHTVASPDMVISSTTETVLPRWSTASQTCYVCVQMTEPSSSCRSCEENKGSKSADIVMRPMQGGGWSRWIGQ